jgi:hypothetical protein
MRAVAAQIEVKERPIIFGPWKVRRILEWDFEKNGDMQTRRVIKNAPKGDFWGKPASVYGRWFLTTNLYPASTHVIGDCPYGTASDRLWVRETFSYDHSKPVKESVIYRADFPEGRVVTSVKGERQVKNWMDDISYVDTNQWYPSIHMPRKFSRITLEITAIKVERLHDISDDDIQAEGITTGDGVWAGSLRAAWIEGWNKINGKRKGCAWDDNPWLWCLSFRRLALPGGISQRG